MKSLEDILKNVLNGAVFGLAFTLSYLVVFNPPYKMRESPVNVLEKTAAVYTTSSILSAYLSSKFRKEN